MKHMFSEYNVNDEKNNLEIDEKIPPKLSDYRCKKCPKCRGCKSHNYEKKNHKLCSCINNTNEISAPTYIVNTPNISTVLTTGNNVGKNIINMNGNQIINLATAINPTDAVNLQQVESLIGTTQGLTNVLSNNNSAGTFQINMNNQKIINLSPGIAPGDAVNVSQLSTISTPTLSSVLNVGNTAGINQINMNNQKIINLAPGSAPTDAVNVSQLSTISTPGLNSVLTVNNSAGNIKITNLANGTNTSDAINLGQLQSAILSQTLGNVMTNGNTASTNLNMNSFIITNLGDGVSLSDAINLGQMQNSLNNQTLGAVLSNGNTANTIINMNSYQINNLANATSPNDAVNLSQVTGLIGTQTLSTILQNGNSAGSNSIDMNNNAINNCSQIQTSLLLPNTVTSGISLFDGSGSSSTKSIYTYSVSITNSITPVIMLTLPLILISCYTINIVGGCICTSGPELYSTGNFYYSEKVKVNNAIAIKETMISDIFVDVAGISITSNVSGTNLNIIAVGKLNNTYNFRGTLELWRHY